MTRTKLIVVVSVLALLTTGCTTEEPDADERIVAPERTLAGATGSLGEVAFSPQGSLLATVTSARPELQFFDTSTGLEIGAPIQTDLSRQYDIAFTPDGRSLLVAGEGMGATRHGVVEFWDVASREQKRPSLRPADKYISAVAVSPLGGRIATAGGDGTRATVRIWNSETGEPERQWEAGHSEGVQEIVFSPDGKWLATADHYGPGDASVRLWDVRTGERLGIAEKVNPTGNLVFSPDGRRVGFPSFVTIKTLETPSLGNLTEKIVGEANEEVSGLAFTPDGRRLVGTGKSYGTVFLWDAATLDVIDWPAVVPGRTFTNRRGAFHSLLPPTISGDGRKLAAGSGEADGSTYVWRLPT